MRFAYSFHDARVGGLLEENDNSHAYNAPPSPFLLDHVLVVHCPGG